MADTSHATQQVKAALKAIENEAATEAEKAEMLMDIAMGLQQKPEKPEDLFAAVDLYRLAMELAPESEVLGIARIRARLATAFLSIPFTDETGKMREALAVQAFKEASTVVNLVDHPSEYAMLQNNLGNALQYVSSSHRVENGYRALEAYDEALKVRHQRDMPEEYANTIANKANCLANLSDDVENPDVGNRKNLTTAIAMLTEAHQIFTERHSDGKAQAVSEAIFELRGELGPSSVLERSGIQ